MKKFRMLLYVTVKSIKPLLISSGMLPILLFYFRIIFAEYVQLFSIQFKNTAKEQLLVPTSLVAFLLCEKRK